jgi:hypothetical protein
MLELADSNAARELTPGEIIQRVKFCHRICKNLLATAGIWMIVGAFSFFCMLVMDDRSHIHDLARIFVLSEIIGVAVLSVALAVRFAIYRCPACDAHLSWLRSDKFRCPSCDAQVKDQE